MVYRPGYVWTGSVWDEIGDPRVGSPEQNAITSTAYTAVLLDVGKTVTRSNAAASTHTIPAQATLAWGANAQLNFLNLGAGTVTITPAADVTINGEPLTLETSKGGSLVRTASNTWTFIPFAAGGVDNANFTNAATGTYTIGADSFKFVTFTGSGSLVVDRAGFVDFMITGAGGGGGSGTGGGGGGGQLRQFDSVYFNTGTFTVTIGGAGGTAAYGNIGNSSSLGQYVCVGGGGGGQESSTFTRGGSGACGGGGGNAISNPASSGGGQAMFGVGGGNGGTNGISYRQGGGGGGMTGGGGNHTVSNGGGGGAGISNSITNTAVTRCGGGGARNGGAGGSGGGGSAGSSGGANLGGGGGSSGNGGSGIVIVRVKTN